MNANGPYTICNLDSNTYTTHYNAAGGGAGAGGGGGGAGQEHHASYGYDYDQYPHGYGGGGAAAGGGGGGCHMDVPAYSDPHGSVITHTQHAPYAMHPCPPPPGHGQPYHPYYGGLVNGDLAGQLASSPGYPPAYPDSYSPGIMGQHPCSTPGYGLGGGTAGGQPAANDQGPVTTYKWMTVKRSQPKTGSGTNPLSLPRAKAHAQKINKIK